MAIDLAEKSSDPAPEFLASSPLTTSPQRRPRSTRSQRTTSAPHAPRWSARPRTAATPWCTCAGTATPASRWWTSAWRSRISCLGTCCGNSKTATGGKSCGWCSPTSACSSTNPPGQSPPGQPASTRVLAHRPLGGRGHPQGLRVQAAFQVPRVLLQGRERIHV